MSIKISELPSAETLGENDIVPIVQDGTTKKITAGTFKADNATVINSSSTNDTPAGAKAVYDYAAPISHADENTTYGQGTESKYGHCKTINNLTASEYTAGEALSSYQGKVLKDAIDGLDEDKQDVIDALHKIGSDSVEDGTFEGNEQSNRFIKVITDDRSLEVKDFATGTYLLKAGVDLALNGVLPAEIVNFGNDTLMITKATDDVVFYYIFDNTDNEDHCRLLYGYEDITERTGTHKYLNIDDIPSTAGGNIDITNGVISTIGNTIKTLDATNDIIINDLNVGVYQVRDNATYKFKSGTGDDYASFTISSQTFMVVSQIEAELPVPTTPKYYYIVDIQNGDVHYGYCKWLNSTQGYSGTHYIIDQSELVDKDYLETKLAEKQAEIDQLYDQIPTATATGDNINIQDSSNLPIKEFDLLGNATQQTYTGKNLFNINGTYYTRANYGTITISGNDITAQNTSGSAYQFVWWNIPVTSGTQYTISYGKLTEGRSDNNNSVSYMFDSTPLTTFVNFEDLTKINKTNMYVTATATESYLVIGLRIAPNCTNTLSQLQVEASASKTTYEPYTGGKASPNPDYPQDIHIVTGDNTFTINDKNLFNKSGTIRNTGECTGTETSNGIKTTANATGNSRYCLVEIPNSNDLLGKKVTIRAEWINSASNRGGFNIFQIKETGVNVKGVGVSAITTSGNSLTLTLPSSYFDETYVKFALALYVNTSGTLAVGDTTTFTNIQIEIGENATNCIPYQAPATQLISLGNIELAKIGDYTDKLFKAIEGDSVYDSLDSTTKASLTSGSWYVEKATGKIIYDGTQAFSRGTAGETQTSIYTTKSDIDSNGNILMCNRFTYASISQVAPANVVGVAISGSDTRIYFCVPNTIATNGATFKTWLESHNTTVLYPLATPTYTQITDTTLLAQLENVLKMHTNKNVTNAWIEPSGTNAQAGLTLTYRQDLATLIAG